VEGKTREGDSVKPPGECLRKSEWEVRPVDLCIAYELVKAYHYAKSGSNTATYLHGLFRRDDWMRCMGVAWWLPPTKAAAVATFKGDWRRVLSLSRLAIAPEVPTNGASFLIGESIRLIRLEGKWDCLVTYADDWRGHSGAIYKATNWEYVGKTQAEATWIAGDGRLVSRKAGPKTRTKEEMESLGHHTVGKFAKHKYRLVIFQPKVEA
jgi:hypothetical protein